MYGLLLCATAIAVASFAFAPAPIISRCELGSMVASQVV